MFCNSIAPVSMQIPIHGRREKSASVCADDVIIILSKKDNVIMTGDDS